MSLQLNLCVTKLEFRQGNEQLQSFLFLTDICAPSDVFDNRLSEIQIKSAMCCKVLFLGYYNAMGFPGHQILKLWAGSWLSLTNKSMSI